MRGRRHECLPKSRMPFLTALLLVFSVAFSSLAARESVRRRGSALAPRGATEWAQRASLAPMDVAQRPPLLSAPHALVGGGGGGAGRAPPV